MPITVADIKREVKEKCYLYPSYVFRYFGNNEKRNPATDEQLDKVLSNKAMFDGSSIEGFVRINESICIYTQIWTLGQFSLGEMKMVALCRMNSL